MTGISGQDGSYLADLLLKKGYEVHGIVRPNAKSGASERLWRIRHSLDRIHLHYASMLNYAELSHIFRTARPDECYHLAGESVVGYKFEREIETLDFNVKSTHMMLSAARTHAPDCKFYFAASSEMFGRPTECPQNEVTPFFPVSAYGVSKLAGYHLMRNCREIYGLFACAGIMYNHESPRRGMEYVTRKISNGVAQIREGAMSELRLGTLDAKRDWGYAPEYVLAMWSMLQADSPDDYVVATGETHTVEDFAQLAFSVVDLDWRDYVSVDQKLVRPAEPSELKGDATKVRRATGWQPSISFEELVGILVQAEIDRSLDNPL